MGLLDLVAIGGLILIRSSSKNDSEGKVTNAHPFQ